MALWVLLMFGPTFLSMVSIWRRDATFAHGFAIPIISLWLLWQRRAALASVPSAPASAGWVCVAVLTIVWLLAELASVQVVAQAAATALLPATLWGALGTEFVRRSALAWAYLAFAVPWGDIFVPALMRFTTEFTVAAVRLVGVPIFRDGNFFSLPSGNFEVIKACSGVRYLIAALALGTLYAGISYRSWRRRAAFIALSIVVPILANGLRAFGIVMIAHLSELRYAVGVDHLIYGWLFFGLVMALLFWIGNLFAEPNAAEPASSAPPLAMAGVSSKVPWRNLVLMGLLVPVAPLAADYLVSASRLDPAVPLVARLPAANAQWRGPTPLQNEWRAAFVAVADATVASARYDSAAGTVLLFVRDHVGDEAPETVLTSRALVTEATGPWRITQTSVQTLTDASEVRSVQLLGNDGARLEVWMWELVNGELVQSTAQGTWLRLRSWLRLEMPVTTLIAVAAAGLDGAEAPRVLNTYLGQYPQLLGTSRSAPP
jgi:exosortase A